MSHQEITYLRTWADDLREAAQCGPGGIESMCGEALLQAGFFLAQRADEISEAIAEDLMYKQNEEKVK